MTARDVARAAGVNGVAIFRYSGGKTTPGPLTCQTSLRNVDQGIRLLLDREDGSLASAGDPPFGPVTAEAGQPADGPHD